MKNQKFWRQGDIGILKFDKLPEGVSEVKHDGILAYGEVTGHKHQLVGGKVKYFRDASGDLFFEVTSRFITLNHGSNPTAIDRRTKSGYRTQQDSHFAHKLPAGIYKVNRQREWDWTEQLIRTVED